MRDLLHDAARRFDEDMGRRQGRDARARGCWELVLPTNHAWFARLFAELAAHELAGTGPAASLGVRGVDAARMAALSRRMGGGATAHSTSAGPFEHFVTAVDSAALQPLLVRAHVHALRELETAVYAVDTTVAGRASSLRDAAAHASILGRLLFGRTPYAADDEAEVERWAATLGSSASPYDVWAVLRRALKRGAVALALTWVVPFLQCLTGDPAALRSAPYQKVLALLHAMVFSPVLHPGSDGRPGLDACRLHVRLALEALLSALEFDGESAPLVEVGDLFDPQLEGSLDCAPESVAPALRQYGGAHVRALAAALDRLEHEAPDPGAPAFTPSVKRARAKTIPETSGRRQSAAHVTGPRKIVPVATFEAAPGQEQPFLPGTGSVAHEELQAHFFKDNAAAKHVIEFCVPAAVGNAIAACVPRAVKEHNTLLRQRLLRESSQAGFDPVNWRDGVNTEVIFGDSLHAVQTAALSFCREACRVALQGAVPHLLPVAETASVHNVAVELAFRYACARLAAPCDKQTEQLWRLTVNACIEQLIRAGGDGRVSRRESRMDISTSSGGHVCSLRKLSSPALSQSALEEEMLRLRRCCTMERLPDPLIGVHAATRWVANAQWTEACRIWVFPKLLAFERPPEAVALVGAVAASLGDESLCERLLRFAVEVSDSCLVSLAAALVDSDMLTVADVDAACRMVPRPWGGARRQLFAAVVAAMPSAVVLNAVLVR